MINLADLKPSMTEEELLKLTEGCSQEEMDQAARWLSYMFLHPAKCRGNLIELARYLMPDPEHPFDYDYSRYKVAKHHRLIADALTEVLEGRCLRLALSIPPQFGKTTLAKNFMGAHIGLYPWKHMLFGTYNQTFAEENGDDLRNIILGEEYRRVFKHLALRMGSKAKDHMVTVDGGKVSFLGRQGSGSGRPADGFLIDDPLKDSKEAESKTIRDDVWNWYTRVANARCHVLTWQVIISTRWSDDDLIARLTDPKNPHYNPDVAKQWTVINVPAEIDDEEMARALGMKVGEALWPERFPLELLHTAKAMDPVGYSALYMGRPTPPEGSFYKRADIYEYHRPDQFPKRCRMYMTGDLAVSPERNADRSCVGVFGLDENDTLWLHPDLYWDRKASDESVEELLDKGKSYQVLEAWFEKGQLDKAIGPFLEKRQQEKGASDARYYFTLSRLPVSGNKGMRSLSTRGRMRQGKVRFPAFAPWWAAAKEEMLKFTGSGEDRADDFCLAAGTKILMAYGGEKNIESVVVGDLVETPQGSRRVIASRMTATAAECFVLRIHGERDLVGTGNHPIYSRSRGKFVRLDHLCERENVGLRRRSFSMAGLIEDTRNRLTGICESIFSVAAARAFFIVTFGSTITARCQTVSPFITRTATQVTTPWRIWKQCRAVSTSASTCLSQEESKNPRRRSLTSRVRLLLNGIVLPRAARGTRSLRVGQVSSVGKLEGKTPVFNLTVEGSHCYYANGILTHNCDMIALIGQALEGQVKADGAPTNVIQMPKIGTWAWTVRASLEEKRRAALLKARGGM